MSETENLSQPVSPAGTPQSLASAIRSGMLWNFVSFVMSQGSGFLIFIILAMRLPPEIFGLVAIASILADAVATDGRYACMDAVVQADRYDKRALSSAFYAFMAVVVAFATMMVVGAPFAGDFYEAPLITEFMPVFGLMMLPVPWLAVMDALIMRELGFRQFTQRNIIGTVTGGVVGIAVAFSPWVIWALVAQRFATLLITAAFEYRYTRWIPGLEFSGARAADFLRRFFPLWAISSLSQVVPRAATLLFGNRYDANAVGLYRAAGRIGESVQAPIVSPMMGLWFPLMAKVRGDFDGERLIYNSILRTAAFLSLPAFAGLIIVAEDVVQVLLPPQYLDVTPILRAVAVVFLTIPLSWFNPIAMTALGRNRASLIYTLITVAGGLAALFLFPNVTIAEAVIVISAPTFVIAIGGNIYLNRRLKQSSLCHYAGLAPAIFGSMVMAAATWFAHQQIKGWLPEWRLVVSVTVGIAVYAGYLFLFHRGWVTERIQLLRGRSSVQTL
jgi:O-antigen/teichoic acid export membrane protein